MKSNPFYALSASAMLLGCWLLGEALRLQAGQLGGLLTLVFVLQLYEGLLVGLGAFLVRTGRAPRDGVTVLALESVFLMDAPLLAAECATADPRVGVGMSVLLLALAVAKLAWVRRSVPGLLSARAAALLGVQAALVLAAPVTATRLASARLFGPLALYGLWWSTMALPFARRRLREETRSGAATRAHATWTWVPAAMILLHLWAVGYIHGVDFQPAFFAPFLLGLALVAGREQVVRKVALPGLAALVSLGQGPSLGFHLPGAGATLVSPLHVAILGVVFTWGNLAWRDRERWLAVLALVGGAAGLVGTSVSSLSNLLGRALRLLEPALPRDPFGWGLLTVIASFVLLGAGARRSLGGGSRPRRDAGRHSDPSGQSWRESSAIALALVIFALSATVDLFEGLSSGQPAQAGSTGLASLAAAAAFVMAVRAHGRAAREPKDAAGQRLAGLAVAASAVGFLLATLQLGASGPHHPERAESAVIGDIRTVVSAEAAYQAANGGFFEARLECLRAPGDCVPAYSADGPRLLDDTLSRLEPKNGYDRSFVPGPPAEGDATTVSRSSVRSYAYVAVPTRPGSSGVRGFCGDSNGAICFTADGVVPRVLPGGTCDLVTCTVLQ
jgi:hypothetical protein